MALQPTVPHDAHTRLEAGDVALPGPAGRSPAAMKPATQPCSAAAWPITSGARTTGVGCWRSTNPVATSICPEPGPGRP